MATIARDLGNRAVTREIRAGRLTPNDSCENCGKLRGPKKRHHAHHPYGYEGENAIRVQWLCAKCHGIIHGRHAAIAKYSKEQYAEWGRQGAAKQARLRVEGVCISDKEKQPNTPNVCECGQLKRRDRCWACNPSRKPRLTDLGIDPISTGQRAAQLRANGMGWAEIIQDLGIPDIPRCRHLAKKYGDPNALAVWPPPYTRPR